MTLRAGDAFGPYRVVAGIGRGAMGEVYRCIDIELGRPTSIWLDGEEAGKAWYLSIQVEHRAARYRMDAAS